MKKCCEQCEQWMDEVEYSGMMSDCGYCRVFHIRKKAGDGDNCNEFDPIDGEKLYI